ncbi:MAG: DUF3179 domain-containing protein [Chloroflexi bacterium]|nr:DUF3179 domain-containing protein [Chloroflexota bacterium]
MTSRSTLLFATLGLSLLFIACSQSPPEDLFEGELPVAIASTNPAASDDFAAPFDLLNPAGKKVVDPGEYRKVIQRDKIVPIYEPRYVTAGEAGLLDDELIMGVSINGDDRAFPIGLISKREIVNGEIGGVPLLVTW